MSEDIIRYDIMVQNALRGVIHKALSEVQRTGLPGNHHFFITFATTAHGVRISKRLREQYAEQMTIVLQHQYRDLDVTEHGFTVGLSFSDVPEMLYVPYSAIRGFYDPSVNFELEFDVESADEFEDEEGENSSNAAPAIGLVQGNKVVPVQESDPKQPVADDDDGGVEDGDETASADGEDSDGADVVSLDSFRKKK